MRIGMTYDLRDEYLAAGYGEEATAEFDSPETVAAIRQALERRGHEVVPIGNLRALAASLVAGERWDLVFNIAEGLRGLAREAQVPALLEAYDIPYTFSDPLTLALTLDKGMTKRIIRDQGIPTAPFTVIHDEAELAALDLSYPLFAKPLAEGTGKGISASSYITWQPQLNAVCRDLLARLQQPVLLEAYLPGREFTVGITGSGHGARAIGVMEIIFTARAEPFGYSYENKEHYQERVAYRCVDDPEAQLAAETALAAWRVLRCQDAGRVDLRSDGSGVPQFLEVNPLAGLHPVRSDLVILARLMGHDHAWLIDAIIDSATQRQGLTRPVAA
jgi:D-alanine-D-alanine ligase